MIKVECYSGYKVHERPVAFTLADRDFRRSFQVREVIDAWLGEVCDYFKVKADDDNIYLLKYDRYQDQWDLIFYQDPRRMDTIQPPAAGVKPPFQPVFERFGSDRSIPIH
ncbi:hypothetical protein [Nitrospina watsonii]|uniref:Uncharacterized protein n=1 Tax=Nitrospina watsonii TaxID=1323948 RepID=A0ABM9HB05_9BACT|nr:hypothetical protein [Nitrospina watsonii]CAI2717302.1 conserved protein of unknown function [Nitrospina watsonii]